MVKEIHVTILINTMITALEIKQHRREVRVLILEEVPKVADIPQGLKIVMPTWKEWCRGLKN
mgnify:CR=1 FL=1